MIYVTYYGRTTPNESIEKLKLKFPTSTFPNISIGYGNPDANEVDFLPTVTIQIDDDEDNRTEIRGNAISFERLKSEVEKLSRSADLLIDLPVDAAPQITIRVSYYGRTTPNESIDKLKIKFPKNKFPNISVGYGNPDANEVAFLPTVTIQIGDDEDNRIEIRGNAITIERLTLEVNKLINLE